MTTSVAVVLEWENVLQAGIDRSRRMLQVLLEQSSELARTRGLRFELIVVYNEEEVDGAIPRQTIAEEFAKGTFPGSVAYYGTQGLHYFDQKNYGAARTEADIVLFLDSDVIPEPGWLGLLLQVFDDPEAKVVCGHTYLATRTTMERCFALIWFFPPHEPRPGVRESRNFYANSVAFRREVFRENNFPEEDCYRGQGNDLAKRLKKKGIKILRVGEAWTSHPWPGSWRFVVLRAFVRGHDTIYWSRRYKRGWLHRSPLGAGVRFLRNYAVVLRRIVERRRAAKLSWGTVALTLPVGAIYCFVVMVAEWVAWVSPQTIRRNVSL